jgi:hypothetical protein
MIKQFLLLVVSILLFHFSHGSHDSAEEMSLLEQSEALEAEPEVLVPYEKRDFWHPFRDEDCRPMTCPPMHKIFQREGAEVKTSICPPTLVSMMKSYSSTPHKNKLPTSYTVCCTTFFQCQQNSLGFTWAQCNNNYLKCVNTILITLNRGNYMIQQRTAFRRLVNFMRSSKYFMCPRFRRIEKRVLECRKVIPTGSVVVHKDHKGHKHKSKHGLGRHSRRGRRHHFYY